MNAGIMAPHFRQAACPVARLRRRAGFTIVELLCATLILIVVALGWFRILNLTSPYKEAQKRAAIELAAGILDIFYPKQESGSPLELGYYRFEGDEKGYPFTRISSVPEDERQYFPKGFFPEDSQVCYTLRYRLGFKKYIRTPQGETKTEYEKESPQSEKWKSASEQVFNVSDETKNPYVVEINLFETPRAKKPFAVFDQLVGFASKSPMLKGF